MRGIYSMDGQFRSDALFCALPQPCLEVQAALIAAPVSHRRQILVVEDHVQVRKMLVRALRQAGMDAFEASTAAEARARLGVTAVHAVVTEIALPGGMDGFDLGDWIRYRSAHMPLVFMTGLTDWQLRPAPPRDPFMRFVRKPFGARVIVDFVMSLLSPALLI
ncbi:response regulator transcription factor [Limobrevibacterium gyesilva]|uniref:Response regulator n=1 Tax=Limobrevibacterium gyesilva TaxID=2991712 RepID=A0AA41YIL7_9PROT|nr:response regulator [Limobrevibacterium gyesilva]MCW3474261.1 response regulator [Limobrevibacterium gyesilva]